MEILTGVTAAAEAPNMLFVAAMGVCTVMIGLICIIVLCSLMSALFRRFGDGEENKAKAAAPAAPAAAPAAAAPVSVAIPNRGELLAAITAAVAEELGTDVQRIRVHSLKRIDSAAPAADPARGELVAAITAAVAEELGTDVQRIRVHSLKKIG